MVKLHRPSENLGNLGISLGSFYADLYKRSAWAGPWATPGLFVSLGGHLKLWITLRGVSWESALGGSRLYFLPRWLRLRT